MMDRAAPELISPMEAILDDPSQVWLTSYYGFTPEDWGFFSFSDKGRMARVIQETVPGFIVVIYGTKGKKTPEDQRGKVIGFYQCSHQTGVAEDFASPLGMDRKRRNQKSESQWNHGIQAVRAWRVVPESYRKVEDFAPRTYVASSGTAISRYGVKLAPDDAANLLKLDVVECDVYGSDLDGIPLLGAAEEVLENPTPKLKPSKAGPVSQSPFQSKESEGPKHLYVLELAGPVETLFDTDLGGQKIVKIGFSKSPEMRCDQFNKSLPQCKLRWKVIHSTHVEGIDPYPTSSHARAGESAMKVFLDRHGDSLGGEFFSASVSQITSAWSAAKQRASEYSS